MAGEIHCPLQFVIDDASSEERMTRIAMMPPPKSTPEPQRPATISPMPTAMACWTATSMRMGRQTRHAEGAIVMTARPVSFEVYLFE
jgi:hypothetical protein